MNNADFWASVRSIITAGFTPEVCLNWMVMQNSLSAEGLYINDFHRENSMAAQRAVQQMSLHPYSREQKIAQIQMLKRLSASSKESANAKG
ncbi:MAG: hypothetical protein J5545_04830 [Bacteroidaceae bacterium]|nr:hypothetical protein [Bacteroidaceae bacterium]